jgi:guanylate kinase
MTPRTSLLIVISAPSGGGKTTLCHQMLTRHSGMTRAITCTTRPPRPGEIDKSDYYFLSTEDFAQRLKAGDFLENATVHNHCYGILKSEVIARLSEGKDVLLNVDVQGAATIRKHAEEDPHLKHALVTVFLTPATLGELELRLRRRGTESPEDLARRLNNARLEIAQWTNFQYLIISTTIPEDVRLMEAIVEAERMRQFRATPPQFD